MKGVNNIKRTMCQNQALPEVGGYVDATVSWKQGDLLFLDLDNGLVKPIGALADGARLLGVAVQSVTNGVQDGPYTGLTDTSPKSGALSGPVFGVEIELTLNTGDALVKGGALFNTADPTVVSSTQGVDAEVVGIYTGQVNIAAAIAGQKVLCHIGCRFPQAVLRL